MIRSTDYSDYERREALRYRIIRRWRADGRRWTDTEIDAAVDAALQRERSAAPTDPPAASSGIQLQLCDHGGAAARTRAAAARDAMRSARTRRDAVELAVASAGRDGMTRHEVADAIGCPVHGLCRAVIDLRESGRIIETERTRLSPYGRPAAVLVSGLLSDG